ncbi:hypothetical protein [Kribbella sp. DT2]|uniref:hypothetical protein n=1 Tax=Kribbella sp. DT2 TaxID=3393427 RepID=UPI003CEBD3FA
MRAEDLTRALHAEPNAFEPLDPAKLIAGHRRRQRRRRRVTVVVVAASVLVAAGVLTKVNGSGSDPLPPASTPSAKPMDAVERACRTEITAAADRSARARDGLAPDLEVVARSALPGVPGEVLVLKDSEVLIGCDTVADSGSAVVTKARPPASTSGSDFETAMNVVKVNGRPMRYYWSAGVLPDGVARIRYRFHYGSQAEAKLTGRYWIMQRLLRLQPPADFPVVVDLLDARGKLVRSYKVNPKGCPLQTRGC